MCRLPITYDLDGLKGAPKDELLDDKVCGSNHVYCRVVNTDSKTKFKKTSPNKQVQIQRRNLDFPHV
jgi:hypothetical protein